MEKRIVKKNNEAISCDAAQDLLDEFLTGELDSKTHTMLEAHVSLCEKCQDEIYLIDSIKGALRGLPEPSPPPEVFHAVAAYVKAHPNKNPSWLHRLFQFFVLPDSFILTLTRAGALICLIIGIVTLSIYQYQQHEKRMQAARDFSYAMSKLNYAVERTNIVFNEKLADVQINRVSWKPFVKIEAASQQVLKYSQNISSAVYQSLEDLGVDPKIKD